MHCNAVWNYTYPSCHMPLTQIMLTSKLSKQYTSVLAHIRLTASVRSPLVFITLLLMLLWVASHRLRSALNFCTTQWSKLFKLNHPQRHWLFMHILAQLSFARETSDSSPVTSLIPRPPTWPGNEANPGLASFPGLPHDLGTRLTQWSSPSDCILCMR